MVVHKKNYYHQTQLIELLTPAIVMVGEV